MTLIFQRLLGAAALAALTVSSGLSAPALAAATAAPAGLDEAIREIALDWETAKFATPEDARAAAMEALQARAEALAGRFPGRAEPLVWDGILLSERAALAGPFSALGLAKRARAALEKAGQIDPAALDGGAPTSLGALYHSVPGFPIGFGDDGDARALLEQAVTLAPEGLDAWYFYGRFLYDKGDYAGAAGALKHALDAPPHPGRPLWDQNRRQDAQRLLAEIGSRS